MPHEGTPAETKNVVELPSYMEMYRLPGKDASEEITAHHFVRYNRSKGSSIYKLIGFRSMRYEYGHYD